VLGSHVIREQNQPTPHSHSHLLSLFSKQHKQIFHLLSLFFLTWPNNNTSTKLTFSSPTNITCKLQPPKKESDSEITPSPHFLSCSVHQHHPPLTTILANPRTCKPSTRQPTHCSNSALNHYLNTFSSPNEITHNQTQQHLEKSSFYTKVSRTHFWGFSSRSKSEIFVAVAELRSKFKASIRWVL
jgi:hypothetical protein